MTKRPLTSDQSQGNLFDDTPQLRDSLPASVPKTKATNFATRAPKQLKDPRFLSIESVAKRYGVGQSTIWRWVAKDSNFPAPIKLSEGTSRWEEAQVCDFESGALRKTSIKKRQATKGQTGKSAKGHKS